MQQFSFYLSLSRRTDPFIYPRELALERDRNTTGTSVSGKNTHRATASDDDRTLLREHTSRYNQEETSASSFNRASQTHDWSVWLGVFSVNVLVARLAALSTTLLHR